MVGSEGAMSGLGDQKSSRLSGDWLELVEELIGGEQVRR